MLQMFLEGLAENNYIIKIYEALLGSYPCQDTIHEPLKCWWGIGQTKWHPIELVMAK